MTKPARIIRYADPRPHSIPDRSRRHGAFRSSARSAASLDEEFPLVMNHLEVYDEHEDLTYVSPIVGPDGGEIVVHFKSQKQGFMGFIDHRDPLDGDLDTDG